MNSALLAFQFLTILPFKVRRVKPGALARSAAYFPAVGLVLGSILAGVNHLLAPYAFNEMAVNIILVIILVILTGGLHLDGLSDTVDALFSGRPKEEMLAIMRDSHAGAMGVMAIVSALLLKIALLSMIGPELKARALILMCVLSRSSMVLLIYSFPYARHSGKAKAFIDGINIWILMIAILTALAIAYFLTGIIGISILGITGACAYLSGSYIKSKIGGITGDAIGAIGEICEVAVLVSFIIAEGVFFN